LLGIKTSSGLSFYDWENLELIRRIEVQPRYVYWNEAGTLVCLATDESYFILKIDTAMIQQTLDSKVLIEEDGIEAAFEVLGEVSEIVKTGLWVGDCFIYTNSVNRINYYVGGEIVTVSHLDRTMYLLGYVPKENRLYLGDKELNITSYSLLLSVLEYQTAVMRRDFDIADRVLPTIPKEHRTRVAHFLEKQGFMKQALQVSTDPEHRFDLALKIEDLDTAIALAREFDSPQKWSQLADIATAQNNFELVQECLTKANDLGGLLLLASSSGDAEMMKDLGDLSHKQGKFNISFLSLLLTGDLEACLNILIETNRIPEAAFFARTYLPDRVSYVLSLWRTELGKINEKAGQSLADPEKYENLFPGFSESLKTQKYLEKERELMAASLASSVPLNIERNALEEMKAMEAQGNFQYSKEDKPGSSQKNLNENDDSEDFKDAQQVAQQIEQMRIGGEGERKNSLDDFDLDIEVDENIDTSDVNLDDELLSD
jgi:coatomer subunit beta'